jgi:hypothetical protein
MAVAIVFFRGRWLTPDVYTVPLGRCDVGWRVDRSTVAMACVGRDIVKVSPLPVQQPWWEDEVGWQGEELVHERQTNFDGMPSPWDQSD